MNGPKLSEQLLALHHALATAGVPHAFGGAISLAFWTLEPRGTRDLDVNLFVDQDDCAGALDALPPGVARPPGTVELIERDGQARLWWDDTPIDVFFDNLPVHRQAARNARTVTFDDEDIPVLGPEELVVFKAMFDRTKDWADIEAMLVAQTVDIRVVHTTLEGLLESDDRRFVRLADAEAAAAAERRAASGA